MRTVCGHITDEIQAKSGAMILVPPYDHKHVMAGKGTVGKELLEEVAARGDSCVTLNYLFVCVGSWRRSYYQRLAAHSPMGSWCTADAQNYWRGEPPLVTENDAQHSSEKRSECTYCWYTLRTIAEQWPQTRLLVRKLMTFAIMQKRVHKIITVSDKELSHIDCICASLESQHENDCGADRVSGAYQSLRELVLAKWGGVPPDSTWAV
jgi:threonine dehydratase